MVEESGRPKPAGYGEHKESFREMVERDDLDGVVIVTPWEWHLPMTTAALRAGKHAAVAAGPANSVDECWEMVDAAEASGKTGYLLENHCYDRWNMAILNMVRQGIFGELIHCQCGYEHDLRGRLVLGKGSGIEPKGEGDYRSNHNQFRNGELYPTHSIGPVANVLNIDRGNRFSYLTSTSTKSRGLREWSENNLPTDHPRRNIDWLQGDVTTTVIKCQNGETVIMNFDTRLPRPHTNMRRVQGTKGIWFQDGNAVSGIKSSVIYLDGISPNHKWESFDSYQERYDHPLWKKYAASGVQGGHRGGDFLKVRGFTESIKRGIRFPIDSYDTAAWKAIAPLSEQSIALGSEPVAFPDFTRGRWMSNKPIFGLTDYY
jgi:hypothetical protein